MDFDVARKRTELEHCPPGQDGRDVALYGLADSLYHRFHRERKIDDLNEAITMHRAALELRPIENDARSLSLNNLAVCLSYRYENQRVISDLEEAVMLGRAALELRPPGHAERSASLYGLACYLKRRFTEKAAVCDLEEAIELHRAALELRPPGYPRRDSSLRQLTLCLADRYDRQGEVNDLEEAIKFGRAELELCLPGHAKRGASLHTLACFLRKRYVKQAAIHDLEEAIELHRAALELRPPGLPDRTSTLCELALCLSSRYDKLGLVDDLEEAIKFGRAALELCLPGHANRGESLHNLACNIRKRFMKQAAIRDLEEAIELYHTALELCSSGQADRPSMLHELAFCLSSRYDKLGVVGDLEEAIVLGRATLELHPLGHPNRGVSLHNLACDLRKSFAHTAVIRDLEESIGLLRSALELRPIRHPDRASTLRQLALCLSHRHDKQSLVDDLEEAVTLGRAALELCSPGHPDRGVVLYNLACDTWKKFQKQTNIHVLQGTNFHHQAASVDRPTSRADVATSLFDLSQYLWDQFQKQGTMTDLDNAICLATYALELRSPLDDVSIGAWVQKLAQGASLGDPVILGQVVDNLCALAIYYRTRFQTQRTTVDLNEAITLYRYILQFRPAGHPNRALSLHDLAECLADRFRQQPTTVDLDDAIALQQEALQLLALGDPDYDRSRRCFTAYLQMKIRSQVAMTSSNALPVTHFEIEQVIRNVVFEALKTTPTRLLHTHTGMLCNRSAQMSTFMSSQRYSQLLSFCRTCHADQRMELIRTVVSRYFQFVTLSHRWGEGEPSLRDIEGRPIYGMSVKGGLGKLQTFCAVACERDYLWAWSDTCCIDKDSSAELQEAIGSMFAWYRWSALTIVYLSDVPDTGSFGSSEWFTRGWTLQELLAPRNMLFYTQNWSLYKNLTSSNHKADVTVLEELERATGVESRFLTDFSPGLDDARSRLQWASSRRTTRPEDIAYSLFGVFNLHLPVLYGDSAENALGRLLAEIISQSGDVSILDWIGEASLFHSCFPAHISSYQMLPSPPSQPNAAESATSQQPTSFKVLRKMCGSLATSLLPQFLRHSQTPSDVAYHISAVRLRTLDSYAPSDVYDFHSLIRAPLPRFINRCLILPCIAHRVKLVQLKRTDPTAPSFTYKIQASGLKPLEIVLPDKLENQTRLQGGLQLVRPWHSKLLGPSAKLDATMDEQLLSTLGRPFNALLLAQLPHNEHRRIAASTLITAQPIDRASILKSKARIFNIV